MPHPSSSPSKPSSSWKSKLLIPSLSTITGLSFRPDFTVNRSLFSLFDLKTPTTTSSFFSVATSDHFVDPARDLWLRLFVPNIKNKKNDGKPQKLLPLIVYFHGGGFALFSPASLMYDSLCRRMALEIPAVIASVNYRLAPEHKCPAQFDDALDALRFLDAQADGVVAASGADLRNCFLAGDGAGANIAHHVAKMFGTTTRDNRNTSEWQNLSKISGLILLQPFFGGEERTESELRLSGRAPLLSVELNDWNWRVFLPEGANRDHLVVHVFGSKEEEEEEEEVGEGFPAAAMVVVGGWDPLQDWQRRYAEGLRVKGRREVRVVEYEGAFHTFYFFPELEECKRMMEEIRGFVDEIKSL